MFTQKMYLNILSVEFSAGFNVLNEYLFTFAKMPQNHIIRDV